MDEVYRRAVTLPERRRFVALTFDGAYKDVLTYAYPVLARHQVPFTVYVATAFPDGIGEAWWLALEQLLGRQTRIDLMMADKERRFAAATTAEKEELFTLLERWLRKLPQAEQSAAIHDLTRRYRVDLAEITREASMTWADLLGLAADPLVTIGNSGVNYTALATTKDAVARREMTMGKAVAEAALQRDIRHFAFPFGDQNSFQRRHVVMAEEAGFATAVSAISGIVDVQGRTNLRALPRIGWDGRRRSMRMMRVLLSGATFADVLPTVSAAT